MTVLVLGAGIIGTAIAEALASRGVQVRVLDMRSPGRGATQASAGILAPYVEAHDNSELLALTRRSLGLFDDFIARVSASSGMPIEYAKSGTVEVALNDDDASRLRIVRKSLDGDGVKTEWLDSAAARAFEPSITPVACGALFIPAHGFVKVASLIAALVQSARLAGAIFESPAEAATVDAGRHGVEVTADGRSYSGDAVVIATGSWSRRVRVANVAALPVRPVRGQLLHLGWPGANAPRRVVWGPACYAVPWDDGSLLVGATVENVGFAEHATVAGVRDLTAAVAELLPSAGEARFEAVRVGFRPVLPDGLPAIGPLQRATRVTVATGHYRNGVLLSPLTAEVVCRYILDGVRDAAFDVTSPDRFVTAHEAH